MVEIMNRVVSSGKIVIDVCIVFLSFSSTVLLHLPVLVGVVAVITAVVIVDGSAISVDMVIVRLLL